MSRTIVVVALGLFLGSSPKAADLPSLDCRALRGELAGLRGDLGALSASLDRLRTSAAMNQRQFEQWAAEAEAASRRAEKRGLDFVKEKLFVVALPRARDYFTTTRPDAARVRELARLEVFVKTAKLGDWFRRDEPSWTTLAEGLKGALERTTGAPARDLAGWVELTFDAARDLGAWFLGWAAIERLDKNGSAFLDAVEASGDRMKKIIARLKELEADPRCR